MLDQLPVELLEIILKQSIKVDSDDELSMNSVKQCVNMLGINQKCRAVMKDMIDINGKRELFQEEFDEVIRESIDKRTRYFITHLLYFNIIPDESYLNITNMGRKVYRALSKQYVNKQLLQDIRNLYCGDQEMYYFTSGNKRIYHEYNIRLTGIEYYKATKNIQINLRDYIESEDHLTTLIDNCH